MRSVCKPRQTRAARYVSGTSRRQGYDGVAYLPEVAGRLQAPRLTWRIDASKEAYNSQELCSDIEHADQAQFVCDTSVFHDQMDSCLWPALINRPGKVLLTPRVLMELEPWLNRREHHPLSKALRDDDGAIVQLNLETWTEPERNAYIHYCNLLSMRKKLYGLVEYQFEQEIGRPPGPGDQEEVRARLQRDFGDRAYFLAQKGRRGSGKTPTYYTDEEVVFTAVISALRTGRETVIVTADEDLLDQLYRLIYLLDSHYRSMLIADVYVEDFGRFRTHPMPTGKAFADVFTGPSSILVERSIDLPNEVLPAHFSPVPIHCWLVGSTFTSMTFIAETKMLDVLDLKGRNSGRNTARLGARNCHLLVPSLPVEDKYGLVFAIAEDRRLTLPRSGWSIPAIEFKQAVLPVERFTHARWTPFV